MAGIQKIGAILPLKVDVKKNGAFYPTPVRMQMAANAVFFRIGSAAYNICRLFVLKILL